jgi:hypothetical protein
LIILAPFGHRASRMSTRSPRIGTPSLRSRSSCIRPRGMRPSARTTRCHGTSCGVVARTCPTRRGARGSMSPYVWTKPFGIARTRARMREARVSGGMLSSL